MGNFDPPAHLAAVLTAQARTQTRILRLRLGQHRFRVGDGRLGFPGAFFGHPSSEPSLEVTNKIENANVSEVNKVNSSEAEPKQSKSKTRLKTWSRGVGLWCLLVGNLFLRRHNVSQTLSPGVTSEKRGSVDNMSEAETET